MAPFPFVSGQTLGAASPVLKALALGLVGALIFAWLKAPLPWMLGSAFVTMAAALMGADIRMPRQTNAVVAPILGVMLGSAFTPAILDELHRWAFSIAALLAFAAAVAAGGAYLLHRRFGYGPVTAYFSAIPGGYVAMYLVGTAMGGDARTIALTSSTRAIITIFAIPFWFRLFEGYVPEGMGVVGPAVDSLAPLDVAILAASAAAGFWTARALRIPAPFVIGPLVFSAAAHLAGLTQASPPGVLVAAAQLAIGAGMGTRFNGVSVRMVASTLAVASAMSVAMIALAVVTARLVAEATGLPFEALLLAYAPGGLAEMSLVSLALQIDPALVSTHHTARIVCVVLFAPVIFRLLARRLNLTEKRDEGG